MKFELQEATINDYEIIQNLARFYVYDIFRFCAIKYEWRTPNNGLFECDDYKHYLENSNCRNFIIRIENEIAGFILIDKKCSVANIDWNMGQFFVVAKFQGTGIANLITKEIFSRYRGKWSVRAIIENIRAVNFWRKAINQFTSNNYKEQSFTAAQLKAASYSDPLPTIFFFFESYSESTLIID